MKKIRAPRFVWVAFAKHIAPPVAFRFTSPRKAELIRRLIADAGSASGYALVRYEICAREVGGE